MSIRPNRRPPEAASWRVRLRLYLSGPMRGIPEQNHPAFHAAAQRLRLIGHEVYNPAEEEAGFRLTRAGYAYY